MFDDRRSKRVVLVAHCVLNQNAKLDACAHYPGAIEEVANELVRSGIGIVQLPCPELACLGLDRGAAIASLPRVDAQDTSIARRMEGEPCRTACREMAAAIARQVAEYRKYAFEVVGLLGIDGSPSCGVGTTWREGAEQRGAGVLVQALREALEEGPGPVAMAGIKAAAPEDALRALRDLLGG